jgi:predicted small lipoprotein YifL
MKTIFYIILISLFTLTSCGRKGALNYPGEKKRPNFDHVIDEE